MAIFVVRNPKPHNWDSMGTHDKGHKDACETCLAPSQRCALRCRPFGLAFDVIGDCGRWCRTRRAPPFVSPHGPHSNVPAKPPQCHNCLHPH